MTVTDTLHLNAARWRLLNHLDHAAAAVNAAALLPGQDAHLQDLRWLGDHDLVTTTLPGRATRLDLCDHLDHGGSPAAVAVKLNARGRRAVRAPQNRLLRRLAEGGPLSLHTLLADTGTDAQTLAALGHRDLLSVQVSATGEALSPADVELLPAATIAVRLTGKGRTYLPRADRPALPAQPGRPQPVPAVTAPVTFPEDGETDVGPGSVMPNGFPGPAVEWYDGSVTGGRVLRISDTDTDQDARVALSAHQIRDLRDELDRTLTAGTAGALGAGAGGVTWQPGPDGRYQVALTGDDDEQAVLTMTPAQMRAWHTQLGADLAEEDTARATFPGITGRLQDKPRPQKYDVDAPLELAAGGLSDEQLAASARALRLYRNGTWRPLAAHLRGDTDPDETLQIRELPGEPGRDERLAEHVAAIDQALAAAPLAAPTTVWRGVRDLAEHTGAELDTDPVGATWTERSFPSTSVDPGVAANFSDFETLLRLHLPAGMGAIQLDSRPTHREHTREAEVLLPRGLTMRVTGESEVAIGGGGTTFRDGKQHIAPPTPYRVLEVEVSMPTPPKRRRNATPPPRQPAAADVELVDVGPAPTKRPAAAEPPAAVPVGPLPRSAEPIRLPNNGEDQGLMHFDSALGMLWQRLGDDRHLQVDGRALGNLVTDMGEGITLRRHDTTDALRELRRLRAQLPDGSSAARRVDIAINRLDAPDRPAPALPEAAPQQLKDLMADLNAIPLVRRGTDDGIGETFHETDQLAESTRRWLNNELSRTEFERALLGLARRRHESHEGYTEIREAVFRALADSRQWLRRRPATP